MNRRHFLTGCTLLTASSLAACSVTGKHSFIIPELEQSADSPIVWCTDVLLHAIRLQNEDVLASSRIFAMAHTAGYIAMTGNSIGKYKPAVLPASVNPELAYGIAFLHTAQEALSVSLAHKRRQFLNDFAPNGVSDETYAWATQQANRVIQSRTQDGAEQAKSRLYPSNYAKQDNVQSWTPTGPFYGAKNGPAFQPFERGLRPNWGAQKPWVMGSVGLFEAVAFPEVNSIEFARQFEKVKALGSVNSTERTKDQTEIALFWEDGLMGVTVVGHFQLIALQLLNQRKPTTEQQARFLALNSLALADAGIVAWHNKYKTDIIRPETAIRFADKRFANSNLSADRKWASYIPTPAFPTYVSGHSLFGAASVGTMRGLLGSDRIDLISPAPDLVNWPSQLKNVRRRYTSLDQIAQENGMSREYGGVHWEIDNTEGLRLGYQLADRILHNQDVIS
jgi:hypothetical protein